MSRYLIGLTGSSSSLIRPIQTINGFTQNYPTTTQRPPTLLTYRSSNLDGVDARVFASTSSLVWNGEPRLDIWNVSIFWPRGISDDEYNRLQLEVCSRPRLPVSHLELQWRRHFKNLENRMWTDQSLTIPRMSLLAQMIVFNVWHPITGEQYDREVLFRAHLVPDLYKQALFQRKMPNNAHNFHTSTQYSKTPLGANIVTQKLTF